MSRHTICSGSYEVQSPEKDASGVEKAAFVFLTTSLDYYVKRLKDAYVYRDPEEIEDLLLELAEEARGIVDEGDAFY